MFPMTLGDLTPQLVLWRIARMSRYDSELINRLRIGHSRLTHTICVVMIHLLVNCVDYLFQ